MGEVTLVSFPKDVKDRAAVACNRRCCICHQFKGLKLEFHHIKQKADGGDDTFENCIPLCFDCHGDMGGVNPRHPKGNSYSENELRMHRDAWYAQCSNSHNSADEPVCEDDRKLFEKIKRCFSGRIGEMLHYQDLRGLHERYAFSDLFSLEYELRDPDNEFVNNALENLRAELLSKISAFTDIYSQNTFPTDADTPDYQVTHLWLYNNGYIPVYQVSEEEERELRETYWEEAEALNDSASNLWKCYCEFLRQGKRIINR